MTVINDEKLREVYANLREKHGMFEAMERLNIWIHKQYQEDGFIALIIDNKSIKELSIQEIPYDGTAGNVEDDIDAAKRGFVVKGMEILRDWLTVKRSPNSGINLIAKERNEQIIKHGRTIEEDAIFNVDSQLVEGARKLTHGTLQVSGNVPELRPKGWSREIWGNMASKPYKNRLITAGALLAAEIDRLTYLENLETQKQD